MSKTHITFWSIECNSCTFSETIPDHYFTLKNRSQEMNYLWEYGGWSSENSLNISTQTQFHLSEYILDFLCANARLQGISYKLFELWLLLFNNRLEFKVDFAKGSGHCKQLVRFEYLEIFHHSMRKPPSWDTNSSSTGEVWIHAASAHYMHNW